MAVVTTEAAVRQRRSLRASDPTLESQDEAVHLTDRNGIYIIDLQQTLTYIDKAYEFVARPSPTADR